MATSNPRLGNDLRSLAPKLGFDPDYLAAFERKLFIEARELTGA